MEPFGNFFSLMLKSCTSFLRMFDNDFFLFCFDTLSEKPNSKIGKELAELTEEAENIMGNGLSLQLNIGVGNVIPSVPGYKSRGGPSPDAARIRWSNYKGMGNSPDGHIINPDNLLGLALILCMMSTAQEQYTASNYDSFDKRTFNNEDLIKWLCDAVDYGNSYYIKKVKVDKKYLLPFLLAALFYCRKWQKDGEKPDFNIGLWLDNYFNALIEISNDAQISDFQYEYYSALWNACKSLDIRDVTSSEKLSSISQNAQISKLYTIPPFIMSIF